MNNADMVEFAGLVDSHKIVDGSRTLPGAYSDAIGKKIPLLWNHTASEVIGGGFVNETAKGLSFSGHFVMTKRGRDVAMLAKSGVIRGLSVNFRPLKTATQRVDGRVVSVHSKVQLREISVHLFQKDPQATITWIGEIPDPEPPEPTPSSVPLPPSLGRVVVAKELRTLQTIHRAQELMAYRFHCQRKNEYLNMLRKYYK